MIHRALGRRIPVELTDDARMRGRVIRLAVVSLVALGLVFGLAATSLDPPAAVLAALGLGWLLMPIVLAWSLRDPQVRYLLVVPSSLVTLGLLAICVAWLPAGTPAAAGWVILTAGVALGAVLGLWLWYRVLPVPASLDDPLAGGRWSLVGVHVVLVVAGWLLAASALLA